MGELENRDIIQELEDLLKQEKQVILEPRHYFADGLYARELTIPKGVMLTGAVHKFEHINIISKGSILVATEDGSKRIDAPATIISRPGTKRVGYALEDTVWTTIHAWPCNEHSVDRVEAELVENYHSLCSKEASCLLP